MNIFRTAAAISPFIAWLDQSHFDNSIGKIRKQYRDYAKTHCALCNAAIPPGRPLRKCKQCRTAFPDTSPNENESARP